MVAGLCRIEVVSEGLALLRDLIMNALNYTSLKVQLAEAIVSVMLEKGSERDVVKAHSIMARALSEWYTIRNMAGPAKVELQNHIMFESQLNN